MISVSAAGYLSFRLTLVFGLVVGHKSMMHDLSISGESFCRYCVVKLLVYITFFCCINTVINVSCVDVVFLDGTVPVEENMDRVLADVRQYCRL